MNALPGQLSTEPARVPPKLAAARPAISRGTAIGLITVLVALAALFVFNPAEHAFYPQCFFHHATGLQCPGCGGLRAMHQLLHGHLLAALHLNALAVVALPVGAWLLAGEFIERRRGLVARHFVRPRWVWCGVAAFLLFSILRNLPAFAFLSP